MSVLLPFLPDMFCVIICYRFSLSSLRSARHRIDVYRDGSEYELYCGSQPGRSKSGGQCIQGSKTGRSVLGTWSCAGGVNSISRKGAITWTKKTM